MARPVPDGLLDTAVAESLKRPARIWHAALAGQSEDDTDRPLHHSLAEREAVVPRADQDALLAGIRDARLVVHAGGDHTLHLEDPVQVAAEIAEFATATA